MSSNKKTLKLKRSQSQVQFKVSFFIIKLEKNQFNSRNNLKTMKTILKLLARDKVSIMNT